jgi:hypothetical protein
MIASRLFRPSVPMLGQVPQPFQKLLGQLDGAVLELHDPVHQ